MSTPQSLEVLAMWPVRHMVRLDTTCLFSVLDKAGLALKHPAYAILTKTPLPFYACLLVTRTSSFQKYVFILLVHLLGCLTLGYLVEFLLCFTYSRY